MKTFIDWFVEKENPFGMSKQDVINWMKRIHNNLLSEGDKIWEGRHYGDCTKENVTCELCTYQTWLEKYEDYCRNPLKKVMNNKYRIKITELYNGKKQYTPMVCLRNKLEFSYIYRDIDGEFEYIIDKNLNQIFETKEEAIELIEDFKKWIDEKQKQQVKTISYEPYE
jgi:hypothetical protein